VIVENKTGSGGNIGTDFVAKAPPDGPHAPRRGAANAINVSLYRTLPFDTKKDLVPVALVGSGANVLVVSAKTPVNNVRELVEHARRNPGKLNFASNGNGTSIHLSGELLKYYGKFDAAHVPFRGAPAAMTALLAGDVDFMFDALSISAPQIRAGRIRLLAVTSRERSAMFPEAPTLVESGFPEFEVSGWTGVMTTGGTPQAIIARLEAELRRILSDRELIAHSKTRHDGELCRRARVRRISRRGNPALGDGGEAFRRAGRLSRRSHRLAGSRPRDGCVRTQSLPRSP